MVFCFLFFFVQWTLPRGSILKVHSFMGDLLFSVKVNYVGYFDELIMEIQM
jgi:hypothetical protein